MVQALATTPGSTPDPSNEPMGFTGTAGEYFRIWIVNTALTIITIGLYSPWAKVRNYKYLYRNSHLADASFDYHADPVMILKGRLIAFALFGLYFATSVFASSFAFLVALAIALAVPYLLVRSRMFAMRYTSYRNVRFRFMPVYKEAYKVIVGQGLLVLITFGLLYPRLRYYRSKMIVDNTRYGTLEFKLGDAVGLNSFYGLYLKAIGAFILLVLLMSPVVGLLAFLFAGVVTTPEGETNPLISFVPLVVTGFAYLAVFYGIDAAIMRRLLNATTVGEHRFQCHWDLRRLIFIQVTNLLAILLSVGLLIPWAKVRTQRYKLENLSVDVQGDLADIAAAQSEEVSALGDEIGEVFDYDFGL
jgi:uncharacterized membrane protein YjgN (DUF898 family)